jgi:nicotinic acetylcholine receptor, invertebrate
MPPTSDQLPLLGVYYAVTISMVSFSTTMTVFTLNISNKGNRNQEIPSIMKLIFFDYIASVFRIKIGSQRIKLKDIESSHETTKAYYQFNEQQNQIPLLTLKTKNCDSECLPVIVQRKRKQANITQRRQIITLKSQKIEHLNIPLQSSDYSNTDKKLIDVLTSLQNSLLANELNYKEQERKQKLIDEWHDLALVIDRLLCYFFIISTLFVCTLVFLNSPYTLSPW